MAQPRQRLNAPASKTDDFIDYMIYNCPVRHCQAIAIEDKYGQWWSAPEWVLGGKVHYNRSLSLTLILSDDPNTAATQIAELITDINHHPDFICVWWSIFGDGSPREDMACLNKDTIREPKSSGWFVFRNNWERVFDLSYPRPEGSPSSAHSLSVRAAKMRHARSCRNKLHRIKKRKMKQDA